ncbi:MAG: DUF255 domain-containing protein [Gemmataceae bacterium]
MPGGANWRGPQEASRKGALFVNVGTADCFWCKKLDAGPFADPEVVKLLNERCVPLKLDANAPANAYLVQACGCRATRP